jgi:hypothetical protein
MNNKNMAVFFIILLLIAGISTVSVVAGDEQLQGDFNAELGKKGSDRSFIVLDGSYLLRNRYFVVKGTVEVRGHSGRFRGIFTDNRFFIKMSVRGCVIFGRCRFDDQHQDFKGIWIERSIPFRGWVTGTFAPVA